MSFIVEIDSGTDPEGKTLPSKVGPFLFRKDATSWGHQNVFNGSFNVSSVQDPRSLRRE